MGKVLHIQYSQWAVVFTVVLMFILLPSVHTKELAQGTISGKTFFFAYTVLIAGILSFLCVMINFPSHIRLSKLDGILAIWTVYILLNTVFKHVPVSIRLLEFYGLVVLYLVLRQIESSKIVLLLAATVIGGIIQAIIGNLQLWGFHSSHHSLFRMTGSFFNPGPYAGYLAGVFPAALGLCLLGVKPFMSVPEKLFRGIGGVAVFILFTVIPVSHSRAAWLSVIASSAVIFMARYPVIRWLKKRSRLKQTAILLLICTVVTVGLTGILTFKPASAGGRLLIWKVALGMIADRPLTGVGIDRFKAFYMNEQAGYFEKHPESTETMTADNTNYCFNEFLQHTAENGLTGLGLMLAAIICALRANGKRFDSFAVIAKAGIAGIAVFALFSYPAQVLPVKISLTCYLACLATLSEGKAWRVRIKKPLMIKCAATAVMTGVVAVCIQNLAAYHTAWKNWGQAYRLYTGGYYTESVSYYGRAWLMLKTNGEYLTHYGKALNMAGKQEQAVDVLRQAVRHYPNTVAYTALGDSYKELGKPGDAERSYLKAWYMIPGRFYPKYLLAKLYDDVGP